MVEYDFFFVRRSGLDKRNGDDTDYFLNEEIEKRSGIERRKLPERRKDLKRIDAWSSVFIGS